MGEFDDPRWEVVRPKPPTPGELKLLIERGAEFSYLLGYMLVALHTDSREFGHVGYLAAECLKNPRLDACIL